MRGDPTIAFRKQPNCREIPMKKYLAIAGDVASAEERSLAEELARNTGYGKDVRNELVVRKAH
jgi:hypothetical protein